MKYLAAPRLLALALTCALALPAGAQTPAAPAAGTPATPAPRPRIMDATSATPKTGDAAFFEKHARNLRRARSGPVRLLFLGDSIDLGPKFLAPDGSIPRTVMPDQLHLSPAGYQLWAEGMQPLLDEMMR